MAAIKALNVVCLSPLLSNQNQKVRLKTLFKVCNQQPKQLLKILQEIVI